jgi:RecB family endonuclease NucS
MNQEIDHRSNQDEVIHLGGLAEVSYHGRAASTVEVGPYLVMIKQDGGWVMAPPLLPCHPCPPRLCPRPTR